MVRLPTISVLVILSSACGGGDAAPSLFIPFPTDVGAAPSEDAQAAVDAPDVPLAPADGSRADVGPTPAGYGACGATVHAAICACPSSDAQCADDALGATSACDTCIAEAQAACCPSQSDALLACAQAAGCSDLTCAQARCPSQARAFQTCITTQWDRAETTMTGACYGALVGCLGAFPVTCGG